MRIPIPASLNPRQPDADTRGLSLVPPSVSAPESDDRSTLIELNGVPHRIPEGWSIATGRHGESDLAFLRRGSEVRVLVGDREGRIHEVRGYSADIRRGILELRFGEPTEQTTEQREVDRLVALSDATSPSSSGTEQTEVQRLAQLADNLE